MNENLKEALEKINSELGETKDNLKYTNKEKNKLNKQNTIMSGQYSEIKKANDQLHGIVYGRFGRK
jgi:predicted nuclease with TOPRIM domain